MMVAPNPFSGTDRATIRSKPSASRRRRAANKLAAACVKSPASDKTSTAAKSRHPGAVSSTGVPPVGRPERRAVPSERSRRKGGDHAATLPGASGTEDSERRTGLRRGDIQSRRDPRMAIRAVDVSNLGTIDEQKEVSRIGLIASRYETAATMKDQESTDLPRLIAATFPVRWDSTSKGLKHRLAGIGAARLLQRCLRSTGSNAMTVHSRCAKFPFAGWPQRIPADLLFRLRLGLGCLNDPMMDFHPMYGDSRGRRDAQPDLFP